MKKIIALAAAIATVMAFCFTVSAEGAAFPERLSGGNVCVYNIELGKTVKGINEGQTVPAATTAKIMTALVVYDLVPDFTAMATVPDIAASEEFIGPAGSKGAPRLGLTVGKDYKISDLVTALLVASSNDAAVTLAHHASGGEMGLFVQKMNEKAREIGAAATAYSSCVGLEDGSVTTVYDASVIAAYFCKNDYLLGLSSTGRAVCDTIGTLHSKNYLTSDYLMVGYKNNQVKGIAAGQLNDVGGYCLFAYYSTGDLSYIIGIMNAPSEERDVTLGTRFFPEENAYRDVHNLIPWLKDSVRLTEIVNPDSNVYSLPVTLSAGKDNVIVIPSGSISVIRDTAAEKSIFVIEESFLSPSLEAPVEPGVEVGAVSVYENGALVGTVPLVTKESIKKGELVSMVSTVKGWLFSDVTFSIIRGMLILLALFMIVSFVRFIVRIIKKYRKGIGKNYYPPID